MCKDPLARGSRGYKGLTELLCLGHGVQEEAQGNLVERSAGHTPGRLWLLAMDGNKWLAGCGAF